MLTTLDLLIAAREKISDPKNWCKNQFAKIDNEANCIAYCARGVLYDLTGWDKVISGKAETLLTSLAKKLVPSDYSNTHAVVYVNDILGHDAVLKLYDEAIATEQARIANGTSA